MGLKIGELASLAGCQAGTIRYYEKEKLLQPPARGKSGYRLYDREDASRLRFILHCRKHGLALESIRKLLLLRDRPDAACSFAHRLIDERLEEVEEEMHSLAALKIELMNLKGQLPCNGHCSVLQSLEDWDGCSCCENMKKHFTEK